MDHLQIRMLLANESTLFLKSLCGTYVCVRGHISSLLCFLIVRTVALLDPYICTICSLLFMVLTFHKIVIKRIFYNFFTYLLLNSY